MNHVRFFTKTGMKKDVGKTQLIKDQPLMVATGYRHLLVISLATSEKVSW